MSEIHRKYLMNNVGPYIYKITAVAFQGAGGTGFLITYNGKSHIITNKHVCNGVGSNGLIQINAKLGIFVQSYRLYKDHDLCVIKAPKILGEGLKLGSNPTIGDNIYMMGHPKLQPARLVSGFYFLTEKIFVEELLSSYRMLITSFPGNSGSPILNIYGHVIGVLYAGSEIDSLAVPLKDLESFLKSLK